MKLSEELRGIYLNAVTARKDIRRRKELEKQAAIKTKVDKIMDGLVDDLKKAAGKCMRTLTVIDDLKTKAEHRPPSMTKTVNVCQPYDLLDQHALVYQRLVDMGLKVTLDYWQTHDYDEPGAYIGGYEMTVHW